MTGTALTEASEFWKIYKLDVIAIPPNRPVQRKTFPDLIYRTEAEKYNAVVEEIENIHNWDRHRRYRRRLHTLIKKESDDEIEFVEKDSAILRVPARRVKEIRRRVGVLVGTVSIQRASSSPPNFLSAALNTSS